jgi:DNA-binding beta-propeller fold protein YncE
VRWNGVDLPTRYVSGTRLAADVPAGQLATPGTAQITVATEGGGVSAPATLQVRPVPAATLTSRRVLALRVRELVYSPHTGRLYATVPPDAAQHANRLVAIDPASGTVTASVFVGSDPVALAVSDDGRVLWVGVNAANAVVRVDAASLTPGQQFPLDGFDAEEIEVMPGRPGTVAVSLAAYCCSPRHKWVAVYDDGARRTETTPGSGVTSNNSIEFSEDGAALYGYDNETTDVGFSVMSVTGSGVQLTRTVGGLITSFHTRIHYGAGRVYAHTGEVIDAARAVRVGVVAGGVSPNRVAAAVSPALGRGFYLDHFGRVDVFDLNDLGLLGSVEVGAFSTDPPGQHRTRLVLWGTDGLAFADVGSVYILRTPIAGA